MHVPEILTSRCLAGHFVQRLPTSVKLKVKVVNDQFIFLAVETMYLATKWIPSEALDERQFIIWVTDFVAVCQANERKNLQEEKSKYS